MNKWRCKQCKWEGMEKDIELKIIFAATQYEPSEYLPYCPSCDSTHIEEVEQILCKTCEDEPVKDEGDQCTECYTEECERHVDASRGH